MIILLLILKHDYIRCSLYIYIFILKAIASNFKEMLLRGSTLPIRYQLDFDYHDHEVLFIISWLICMQNVIKIYHVNQEL